jgi:hypothetical protein
MTKVLEQSIQNDETLALFRDLNKPSLHALSYVLRHPDTWPEGFVWDYSRCESCAMGLAHSLWRESVPKTNIDNAASYMARTFSMPFAEAKSIFLGGRSWVPKETFSDGHLWWRKERHRADHDAVTPEMVADQIDAYLSRAE